MEKIAEFDKEIIATVCGSFRRGIGNSQLVFYCLMIVITQRRIQGFGLGG